MFGLVVAMGSVVVAVGLVAVELMISTVVVGEGRKSDGE